MFWPQCLKKMSSKNENFFIYFFRKSKSLQSKFSQSIFSKVSSMIFTSVHCMCRGSFLQLHTQIASWSFGHLVHTGRFNNTNFIGFIPKKENIRGKNLQKKDSLEKSFITNRMKKKMMMKAEMHAFSNFGNLVTCICPRCPREHQTLKQSWTMTITHRWSGTGHRPRGCGRAGPQAPGGRPSAARPRPCSPRRQSAACRAAAPGDGDGMVRADGTGWWWEGGVPPPPGLGRPPPLPTTRRNSFDLQTALGNMRKIGEGAVVVVRPPQATNQMRRLTPHHHRVFVDSCKPWWGGEWMSNIPHREVGGHTSPSAHQHGVGGG